MPPTTIQLRLEEDATNVFQKCRCLKSVVPTCSRNWLCWQHLCCLELTFVTQKIWVRLCNELLSPCEHFYVLFQMLQTQRNKTKIHTWFFVWIWNVFEKLLYQTFISNDTLVSTSFMTSQDSTLFLLFCWVTSLKILLSNSIGLCTDMSLQLIAYHNLAFSSPSISTLVLLSLNFQRWIISSLFCHSSGPLCLSPPFLAFF